MSRIQLALDVDDIDQAVEFYTKLFGAEPAKRRPGYANFAVVDPPLKLVLLERPGRGGNLDHLGVEVGSTEEVHAHLARIAANGLAVEEEMGTTCCHARQDKFWVTGPGGERWEHYVVVADSQTFGADTSASTDTATSTEPAASTKPQASTGAAAGTEAATRTGADSACCAPAAASPR